MQPGPPSLFFLPPFLPPVFFVLESLLRGELVALETIFTPPPSVPSWRLFFFISEIFWRFAEARACFGFFFSTMRRELFFCFGRSHPYRPDSSRTLTGRRLRGESRLYISRWPGLERTP